MDMWKQIYARKLRAGEKTALAYHTKRSEEYISKLTRYGGDPCPAERYFKWFCALHHVSPSTAIALHDYLNSNVSDLRQDAAGEWNPCQTAASLVRRAADTVAALITDATTDDEQALLDLKADVEKAIEQCRARRIAPKLREAKSR